MVVALDGTCLTVAQPTLRRELGASLDQAQWTSTGYLVAVAGLLVFAGRLGDRYGHRHTFAAGMLGFGAASAGLVVAPSIAWVIGLRVAQGVFGALLQPAGLGMLRAAYPPDRLRTPLAIRTAAIGVAAATGPVVGGALATAYGWRAVFVLTLAPTLVFGLLALVDRDTDAPRPSTPLDLPGALLLAVALASLVHALVALTPGTAALGIAAALAFVLHERRTPTPLLPPDVVRSPVVAGGLAVLITASASLNGGLFACVYLLQGDLGLTPLHSALLSLPLAVTLIGSAPACAVLLKRAGSRRTTAGALALLAAGLLVLAGASAQAVFCVGFALVGAGFGAVMVAGTHAVVKEAPVAFAGVAGGLQQTAMNVGPVLGVAVATVLMGSARVPLVMLAGVTVLTVPVCRMLPGVTGAVNSEPTAVTAGSPSA
ncbi:MFS transporter [Streptomyces niveiscabiei]|uniref:MFS transporter n=1 Tax=Streptomyces niveiscabiei TaxID=164115 RepID=UPI0038998A90